MVVDFDSLVPVVGLTIAFGLLMLLMWLNKKEHVNFLQKEIDMRDRVWIEYHESDKKS